MSDDYLSINPSIKKIDFNDVIYLDIISFSNKIVSIYEAGIGNLICNFNYKGEHMEVKFCENTSLSSVSISHNENKIIIPFKKRYENYDELLFHIIFILNLKECNFDYMKSDEKTIEYFLDSGKNIKDVLNVIANALYNTPTIFNLERLKNCIKRLKI